MPIGTRDSYSGELSKSRRNISRRNRIRNLPSRTPSPTSCCCFAPPSPRSHQLPNSHGLMAWSFSNGNCFDTDPGPDLLGLARPTVPGQKTPKCVCTVCRLPLWSLEGAKLMKRPVSLPLNSSLIFLRICIAAPRIIVHRVHVTADALSAFRLEWWGWPGSSSDGRDANEMFWQIVQRLLG